MLQTCLLTGKQFQVFPEDEKFFEKIAMPVPNIHPIEYLRCAMSHRNERSLYHRKCDKTGKAIISAYHEDCRFPVYENEYWWSDNWDAIEYGITYNSSASFVEQFNHVQSLVPREGTSVFRSENCDYNAHIRDSKNCYLCSLIYNCEDCMYNYWVGNNTKVLDSYFVLDSELCYECINCQRCYNCIKVQESKNCSECYFSYHLQGCDHCIGCSNLSHKSYYVHNKQVDKDTFETIKKTYINGSYSALKKGDLLLETIRKNGVHRALYNLNCENVLGDNLRDCKNCYFAFLGDKSEDCRYSVSLNSSKDVQSSYAINVPNANELIFASSVVRGSTNIAFSYYIWNSSNMRYCDSCISCNDCFGCIGLKHMQFCILNTQYTKDEYQKIVSQIEESMKQEKEYMLPPVFLSSFAYNESAAQDYMPLSKDLAQQRGFTWYEEEKVSKKYMGPDIEMPDNIQNTSDSIIDNILSCSISQKPYKITPKELLFYRKMSLPIPRQCSNQRLIDRLKMRDPCRIFNRTCAKCSKKIQTTYAPDRPETVYCEECYLKTIT